MSRTPEQVREFRAERVAAGLCSRCGEARGDHGSLCEKHAEAHRERNRRYWERRGRAVQGRVTLAERRAGEAAIRAERVRILVAWAEAHGSIPTYRECNKILGMAQRNGAGTEVQEVRREAFGLCRMGSAVGRSFRIPYPVPAQYRAEQKVSA